jgi:hypothetical protein
MNARGATVPLSPGCFEICAKSDLRAEERVCGVEGIDSPGAVGVLFQPVSDVPRPSVVENLRSGLFRTVVAGAGGCDVCGAWAIGGSVGVDGPGSCRSSSRNGLQKYKA